MKRTLLIITLGISALAALAFPKDEVDGEIYAICGGEIPPKFKDGEYVFTTLPPFQCH